MQYKVVGETLPVLILDLDPNEQILTEAGAMSWMTDNLHLETKGGGVGKVLGRMLSGDTAFQNIYTCVGRAGQIGMASKMPGSIRAFEITPQRSLILQKGAFLASTKGIDLSIHFKKKLGASLFGGEGFILQKVSGQGLVFVEIDGYAVDYTLAPAEKLIVDTGFLAIMDETCTMDIVSVPGIKNILLGGEGLFNTVITGPGNVTLQTMSMSSLANCLIPFLPAPSK